MAADLVRITAHWQGELLLHGVDRSARERPDAAYGLWPVEAASHEAGFDTITYSQLANIVNGLAWWIVEQLGHGQNNEVLTYVGPNDVRFTAMVVAATKAGYVLFLTSPRNSPEAHRALFNSLKCRTLVTTEPLSPPALAILDAVKPGHLSIPSVGELLRKQHQPYPYYKTFQMARQDPVMIMHTSGTTGLPKPIIWTHETAARQYNCVATDPPEGIPSLDEFYHGKRVISTLPPFHGAGLSQYLYVSIPFGNTIITPEGSGIVTAHSLVSALKQTPADVAILVPSVVAELAQDPQLLGYCAEHLQLIIYIGGDLPQALGDRVAEKVPLRCQWGASEVGIPHQLLPSEYRREDWRYIRFHPCVGAIFEQVTDGAYELVIKRDENSSTQAAFTIRGQENLTEYRTRDLFVPHPTIPDAWRWQARADDIIVFLNGEKTNPVSMEQHIVAENPELSGALVIGAQRFQAALLIEPAVANSPLTTAEEAALIERVWPSVEEANRVTPAHARVEKSLILITSADRRLIRAGKGTIQRPVSLALYKDDIDRLYANAEQVTVDDGALGMLDLDDPDAIARFIREKALSILEWSSLDDSASFFDGGMDSLQALRLTRALQRGLKRADLSLSMVYQNPSVPQLAAVLAQQRNDQPDGRSVMESLLTTYSGVIEQIPIPKPQSTEITWKRGDTVNVILTGSTGTLGTQMLHALLQRPGIGHVFCLNRASDGGLAAQLKTFEFHAFDTEVLKSRVSFLSANLANPSLGLDAATYDKLRDHAGLLIHNAWPVNFNLSLLAFRPHLVGVVNLIALSAAAPSPMRVLFISSVSAAGNRIEGAPEKILRDFDAPYTQGYARSKFITELLCDTAAKHLGIPVAVVRVGQIAGPAHIPGIWNPSEWLPSLVLGSLEMGCLPDNLGSVFDVVDWVPSDVLGEVVVDLATLEGFSESAAFEAQVFNVRNPHKTSWKALLPAITDTARGGLGDGKGRELEIVTPEIWLKNLEEGMQSEGDAFKSNPALKLLDFYRESLWAADESQQMSQPMVVTKTIASSITLRELGQVRPEWMSKWVREWTVNIE
ncbi:putative NRPS-like enzyme [Xylariaceae sp. FL1651]|nr:putative NRPS-like enzyme [Xylariaceae sp. FL1651]